MNLYLFAALLFVVLINSDIGNAIQAEQIAVKGESVKCTLAVELEEGTAEVIDLAYKAYSEIFGKFGSKAAEALKGLDAAYGLKTLEFTSGPAREFIANSMDFFAKKEDWAKFWSTIGNTEQSAIKGDKIMQKLTVELGNTEASEKAMRQTAGLSISTSWLIGFKPMLY